MSVFRLTPRNQPEERRSQRPTCQYIQLCCCSQWARSAMHRPCKFRQITPLLTLQLVTALPVHYDFTVSLNVHTVKMDISSESSWCYQQKKGSAMPTDARARTHLYFDYIWHNQPKITAEISNFWLFLLSYGYQGTRARTKSSGLVHFTAPLSYLQFCLALRSYYFASSCDPCQCFVQD